MENNLIKEENFRPEDQDCQFLSKPWSIEHVECSRLLSRQTLIVPKEKRKVLHWQSM
jgi:hypothetical protein